VEVFPPPVPLPVGLPPELLPPDVVGEPVCVVPDPVPVLVAGPGLPGVGDELSLPQATTTSEPKIQASRLRFIDPISES
jgi:hypothetical protein